MAKRISLYGHQLTERTQKLFALSKCLSNHLVRKVKVYSIFYSTFLTLRCHHITEGLGKRNNATAKNSNAQKNFTEPKQRDPKSENLNAPMDSRIDSDLTEIMDAQIDKIETDDQWAEKWMVDYEGYQPIGEPNLSPPRPKPLKKHQCSYCPKTFAHAGHLRMHETVHSQNRPFGKCLNLMNFYKKLNALLYNIILSLQMLSEKFQKEMRLTKSHENLSY